MADLIAIAFDDTERARQVRSQLMKLQRRHLVDLEDAAVVIHRANGRIKLDQTHDLTAEGALSGAFWGTLIGLLLLNPLLGMGLGLATGAIAGALADVGVDDRFMKELAENMPPGSSALFILVRQAAYDRLLEELFPFQGRIIHTSLSREQEQRLHALVHRYSGPTSELIQPSPTAQPLPPA